MLSETCNTVAAAAAAAAAAAGRFIQQIAQTFDFFLIVVDDGIDGILIDPRPVLYVLGSIGVAQRAERLVVIVVGRRHARYHQRFRVAAQRVLRVFFVANPSLTISCFKGIA